MTTAPQGRASGPSYPFEVEEPKPAPPGFVGWIQIVAADRRGGIGRAGALPWRLPDDLRWFKRQTVGHAVIMGRRTYESLGRPLADRTNVVLSRAARPPEPGVAWCPDLAAAQAVVTRAGDRTPFVIGGGELYRQTFARTGRVVLTLVDAALEADTRYDLDAIADWTVRSRRWHDRDADHAYPFCHLVLDRPLPARPPPTAGEP